MKPTRSVRLGRICKKHTAANGLRYVGNNNCVECAKESSRKHYASLDMTPAQKITTLLGEVSRLRKALTDLDESIEREYWSEYAGLDDTHAILDAALGKTEKATP